MTTQQTGPLIVQPQAMPDLSQLTERGAKAWAGVDAQGLRDGGASPSANAGGASAHIKEPYTIAEIKAKIDSNDYSAEMLLQHAMLLLDSVQEDAMRYRWLREGNDAKHGAAWHVAVNLYGCEWDAAIDAAMNKGATQ